MIAMIEEGVGEREGEGENGLRRKECGVGRERWTRKLARAMSKKGRRSLEANLLLL